MASPNQMICLSTFEYTTTGISGLTTICTHCPSCGVRIDVRQESLVNRFSSVLLLFGASAYVIYRLTEFCPKMKRISKKFWQLLGYQSNTLEPVFFINKLNSSSVEFNESRLRTSCHWDVEDVPDLDLSLPKTPVSPFYNHLDINLNYNIFNDTYSSANDRNDNLIRSGNSGKNRTVDRIDEVLTQIDDIKKSIVEIDSQIFDFSGSKCVNFNPAFFTLTNTDLNEEPDDFDKQLNVADLSDDDHYPQSPSTPLQDMNLEWDLTDVENDSLYYGSEELDVESALSLPVTDTEKQKLKSMQDLFEDAKQLGLLNTILDAISSKVIEDNTRDSAYFEQ